MKGFRIKEFILLLIINIIIVSDVPVANTIFSFIINFGTKFMNVFVWVNLVWNEQVRDFIFFTNFATEKKLFISNFNSMLVTLDFILIYVTYAIDLVEQVEVIFLQFHLNSLNSWLNNNVTHCCATNRDDNGQESR